MKTSYKLFAVFAVLLLAGGGCLGGGQTDNTNTDSNGETETAVSNDGTFTGSLAAALQLGQSMKCTWSSSEGDGVTYIKDEKVRSEITADGQQSYVIGDGDCTYIWEEGQPEGFEFCTPADSMEGADDAEFVDFDTPSSSSSGMTNDADAVPDDVDINCSVTNVSDAMFEPPSDVNFSNPFADLEALMTF